MKFLRLQFISIPGHVLCAYCGCPPARHGKGLLRQTKTQGDKWKWITLKIRQSSPFFRDDIATRGEKARETEGLLPGCHYRQSVLSSFYANQHEYAFSLQYLHLQDSLASTAPCRSSPSESDQSDRFKFFTKKTKTLMSFRSDETSSGVSSFASGRQRRARRWRPSWQVRQILQSLAIVRSD